MKRRLEQRLREGEGCGPHIFLGSPLGEEEMPSNKMTSPGTLSFRFMHTGPPSQFSLLAISFPPQGFAQTVPPAQPFFLHPWSLDQLFIFQVSVSMPLPQVGPLCPSTHGNLGALPQLFLQSFLLVINTV